MIYFGCFPLLIIFIGFVLLMSVLRLGVHVLDRIGATAVWIWESFLNLFRSEKREVINPWSGRSNFDDPRQSSDITFQPTEQRPKRYDKSDGEYVDFTDVK